MFLQRICIILTNVNVSVKKRKAVRCRHASSTHETIFVIGNETPGQSAAKVRESTHHYPGSRSTNQNPLVIVAGPPVVLISKGLYIFSPVVKRMSFLNTGPA